MIKKTSEKTLEKNLREGVRKLGGLALKLFCPSFTGLPDRIVLLKGGHVKFAEIKTTGKKLTARQEFVHRILLKLGFFVWVIDTPEQLDEFLNYCEHAGI